MKYLLLFISVFSFLITQAQSGMTVSPGKLYYFGESVASPQKIKIINPTDQELEVGISLSDWTYDENGSNDIQPMNSLPESAANWVRILPGTHITIPGNSFKEIEVSLQVPKQGSGRNSVHTAMIFLTQLNPGNSKDASGAAIKVAVRIGVKIYHAAGETEGKITIDDLTAMKDPNNTKWAQLNYSNTGSIWTEGKVTWTVFSYETGKTSTLGEEEFYTLPLDRRRSKIQLPDALPAGRYSVTARISFGKNKTIQMAEMDFEI